MPAFHDVIFPTDISYGSSGGPTFFTTIKELASGHEQRNVNWSESKARYDAKYGVRTETQMQALVDFFYARNGRAYGFRYYDHLDHLVDDVEIGIGDGVETTFQIFKRYESATAYYFDRAIRKPINDATFVVTLDDVPTVAYSVDYATGIITMNVAPSSSVSVKVTCNFHVPVRFDIDHLDPAYDEYNNLSVPSIPLVEIRPQS